MSILDSGIYIIENKINNKMYVGSSSSLDLRWKQHLSSLQKLKHNKKLQSDWNIFGKDAFKYYVIEYVKPVREILLRREQYWIDLLNVVSVGYNAAPKAGSNLGCKYPPQTKEHRMKKGLALKGIAKSPEHVEKVRLANIGKHHRVRSEEEKRLQSSKTKGVAKGPRSEQHCKNLSIARTGLKVGPQSFKDRKNKSISANKRFEGIGIRSVLENIFKESNCFYTLSELIQKTGKSANCIYRGIHELKHPISEFGIQIILKSVYRDYKYGYVKVENVNIK